MAALKSTHAVRSVKSSTGTGEPCRQLVGATVDVADDVVTCCSGISHPGFSCLCSSILSAGTDKTAVFATGDRSLWIADFPIAVPAYAATMPPENIEWRVTALEGQVRDLRKRVGASEQDAAAARVLAGGADRDVGAIRGEVRHFKKATIASFNALRQNMNDGFRRVDERFARMDERFARIDGQFDQVGNGFTEMRAKFDMTAAGQQRIVELIQTVIAAQGGDATD